MSFDQKFADLMAQCESDPSAKASFEKDPVAALQSAGIPVVPSFQPPSAPATAPGLMGAAASDGEHVNVTSAWWGIDFRMSEKLTQDIAIGAGATEGLTAALLGGLAAVNIVAGAAAGVIAAGLAIVIIEKVAEIEIVDNGSGVHWPISWPQWAGLIASVPAGPVAMAASANLFLHPVRN